MSRANTLVAKRARRQHRKERMAKNGEKKTIQLSKEHAALLEAAAALKASIGEMPMKYAQELAARYAAMCMAVDYFLEAAGLNPLGPGETGETNGDGKVHVKGRVVDNADGTTEIVPVESDGVTPIKTNVQ